MFFLPAPKPGYWFSFSSERRRSSHHSSQSAVDQVIERMDDYYLSKEDWDTILELGVDDKKDQIVAKAISTATKSALTKKWVVIHSGCFAQ